MIPFVLCPLLALTVSASFDQVLERRTVLPGGGWALMSNGSCPRGSSIVANSQACCPVAYVAENTSGAGAHLCCPRASDCLSSLQSTPYCANTGWVLWNATSQTQGSGYFCCVDEDTGTQSMGCTSGSVNSGDSAARLGRPEPSGITHSGTKTKSATFTSTGPGGTGTSATTSTTTASGATANSGSSTATPASSTSPSASASSGAGLALMPEEFRILGLLGALLFAAHM